MSLFDQVASSLKTSAVRSVATQAASHLPLEVQKHRAFGAALDMLEGGSFAHGFGSPILGGVSLSAARRIVAESQAQKYSRKNLWMLEVSSELRGGLLNVPALFNLFATDVQYSPASPLNADVVKVGGANVDNVQSGEPGEITITTFDDTEGTLKKWFIAHHKAAVSSDGTVKEPAKYAIKIRIIHGAIEETRGHFESVRLVRPVSLETTLSRTEDGMEELQMTFAQLDTFMRP